MGKTLRDELPEGRRRARADQRRLAGQRAQRDDEPERGAAHGLHPGRARRSRAPRADAARDRRPDPRDLLDEQYPRRRVPAVAGRARRERLLERLLRADRRRDPRTTTSTQLEAQAQARSPRSRARVPASATSASTLQTDYPEIHVDTIREQAGMVGVTARDGGAGHARRDARQHQHAERVDRLRNGQAYYVVTYYDERDVADVQRARAAPGARRRRRQARRARRVRRHRARRRARSRSSATTCSASPHVFMQTEGRDVGSAAAELEHKLAADPRTRGIKWQLRRRRWS